MGKGAKKDRVYWNMSDFAGYCSGIGESIDNPTVLFSRILKELENSYKARWGTPIELKSAFRKNKSYAFDIKEQENHEDEEQKSFEERQMKKLFYILYFWKDERWNFTYLMDVNGYLIDLVRRYDKKDGELIAIPEEEINQIKAMIDDAIYSLIYLDLRSGGSKKIICKMGKVFKERLDKCSRLKAEKDFDSMIDFIKRFYEFTIKCDEKLDKNNREFQRRWSNILLTMLLGDGVKDLAEKYPDQGIKKEYLDVVTKKKMKEVLEEGLAKIPKIDIKPNLQKMSEEELLTLQYHILDELSSRIIQKNDD